MSTIKGYRAGLRRDALLSCAVIACALSVTACSSETEPEDGLPMAVADAYTAYPESISSFGATVLDGAAYVYSGHIGETHSHSIDNLSTGFRSLDLSDSAAGWTDLAFQDPVQSNALVAYGGMVYRVAGMTATNGIDDIEEELFGTDVFSRYDPAADVWEDLPALPELRSSHDAVVVGSTLYALGGWKLSGGDSASGEFYTSSLKIDLTAVESGWEAFDHPFQRRAICAAARDGLIYVIGGITPQGSGSVEVDVYDTQSESWSTGPAVPSAGDSFNAFGCSAFGVDGQLYFSGRDGTVMRLDEAGAAWTPVGQLNTPRFFHRLVAGDGSELLMIGGADITGDHLASIESLGL